MFCFIIARYLCCSWQTRPGSISACDFKLDRYFWIPDCINGENTYSIFNTYMLVESRENQNNQQRVSSALRGQAFQQGTIP